MLGTHRSGGPDSTTVRVILWVLIVLLVAYLGATKVDVQDDVAA